MAKNDLPGSKNKPAKEKSPNPVGRPRKYTYTCTCCGTVYNKQETAFMATSSELFESNNGYYPVCKNCLEHHFTEKLLPALENDEKRALEMMCGLCDWYFSEEAVLMAQRAKEKQTNGVLSSIYAGKRALKQIKRNGQTYIDTIMQRREAAVRITDIAEATGESVDPDANHTEVDKGVIHMFGLGYSPDEYDYLDEQYKDWMSRYECSTKAMEECIKALCVAQLNIRRAQVAGDSKATTDAMKAFNDMLTTAKLAPKQNKIDQLAQTETFGSLIALWEKDQPIPEPEDEFKDVDGIRKLVNTWFFGHLAKMFNIKNDYVDEYEEEAAKYSVKPPVYDGEDEESSEEIEKIFGNAKHSDSGEEDD